MSLSLHPSQGLNPSFELKRELQMEGKPIAGSAHSQQYELMSQTACFLQGMGRLPRELDTGARYARGRHAY